MPNYTNYQHFSTVFLIVCIRWKALELPTIYLKWKCQLWPNVYEFLLKRTASLCFMDFFTGIVNMFLVLSSFYIKYSYLCLYSSITLFNTRRTVKCHTVRTVVELKVRYICIDSLVTLSGNINGTQDLI